MKGGVRTPTLDRSMKSLAFRITAASFVFAGAMAFAHVWFVDKGVHFKGRADVDFGTVPHRLGVASNNSSMDSLPAWRPGTTYLHYRSWEQEEEHERREIAGFRSCRQALEAEDRGEYGRALAQYRRILADGCGDAAFLRKRVAILDAAHARETTGLQPLLKLTRPRGNRSKADFDVAPELKLFQIYEKASWVETTGSRDVAAAQLFAAARTTPNAPGADVCLITCARNLLRECPRKPTGRELNLANHALETLIKQCPNSRFVWPARAWRARIDFLRGRLSRAIEAYREIAAYATDKDLQSSARESIALVYLALGRRADAAAWYLRRYVAAEDESSLADFRRMIERFRGVEARAFWRVVKADPILLDDYVEYRIDHTRVTLDLVKVGESTLNTALPNTLSNFAAIALELRQPEAARKFAAATLARQPSGDPRARANFVLGSLALRQGRRSDAEQRYASILRQDPKSYLVGGAKENLALLAECQNRFGEALRLYSDLGYDFDVAYLADARMSPADLEAYLRQPSVSHRGVLTYTLGMRYLRLARWRDAERTFARLTTRQRRALTTIGGGGSGPDADAPLQDPLATLRALRSLDSRFRRAQGAEKRANARLAMANYYYSHRPLLLYSPALWHGDRAYTVTFSWNPNAASKADDAALARHHDEHECLAQTLRICKEIIRDYPHTRAADHAAYRGACAAERLANMSAYWRWQDDNRNLSGQATYLFTRASHSHEPDLARRARKYAAVSAAEAARDRRVFLHEPKLIRHWNPNL